MTYHDLAVAARATLEAAGIDGATAARDADLLARHALGWDLAAWLANRHTASRPGFAETFDGLITRRQSREPVAYIRGTQEFWGREFLVTPAVLIPRPETELLIEVTQAFLRSHPRAVVADIGTGSGCIAVTLALEHPGIRVCAIDVSAGALAVARRNAARLGVSGRIDFVHGPHLDGAPTLLDLVVSNPPYVVDGEANALAPEVRLHEPALAVFGGGWDGLNEIRHIIHASRDRLTPDGLLAFEIGFGQAVAVQRELQLVEALELVAIHNDLQSIPRVVVARRKNSETQ